eukprot:Nitzschia sp. Nitz4//scaffold65_size103378//64351//65120//NITZ4_004472-RA/size103378-snap-gene-0.14-mRNA-1//-1//CDS//3329556258//5236//frame0
MSKPSPTMATALRIGFLTYSIGAGYYMATKGGKWKSPFSWHPFLMTVGMIGCMGTAAITKKLGGYLNTKIHGMLANLGVMLSLGGLYAIYHNKNLWNKPHFTSPHGKMGVAVVVGGLGAGLVGAVMLHPDFGMDKTNKTIRMAHKLFSRTVMGLSWVVACSGVIHMTEDPVERLLFGVPLLLVAPLTLF